MAHSMAFTRYLAAPLSRAARERRQIESCCTQNLGAASLRGDTSRHCVVRIRSAVKLPSDAVRRKRLDLNFHLHAVLPDGVFVEDEEEEVVDFLKLAPPTREELAQVLHRIDPKNRDTTHAVTAEELYNEEVQVNSIAAAYYSTKSGSPRA